MSTLYIIVESIDLLRFILLVDTPAKLVSKGIRISSCATSLRLVSEKKRKNR